MPEETEKKKLVSIVVPAYNESEVIGELGRRLAELMDRRPEYDFEAVIVENGSHDNSFELLAGLHKKDQRFKVVQLSRNFTADGGVCAGLRHASGDCAILMDADLQDPPEIVDNFLEKWEEGFEVVYGVIRSRDEVSPLRKVVNAVFYYFLNKSTGGIMPRNVTAFRLMDRKVYRILNRMPETNRFTRGLCAWTGFRQTGIEFDRAGRFAGEAKAGFWEIFEEAIDALVGFSFIPLKLISGLGILMGVGCFLMIFVELLLVLIFGRNVEGIETIIVLILGLFSFLFFSLGIMGEYVGRIFAEVKRRPNYIVNRSLGFNQNIDDDYKE